MAVKKRKKKKKYFKTVKFKRFAKKHKKALIMAATILVAVIVSVAVYNIMLNLKFSYTGLGAKKDYPASTYDMRYLYRNEQNLKCYDSGLVKGIPGIDVSEHQKYIDWQKVSDYGVEFAMIRLGRSSCVDGRIHKDLYYENNIREAQKAGIKVGVYFYSQAVTEEEAINEAKYVVETIKKEKITMPVAFDMEPFREDDRIHSTGKEEKTKIVDAFCSNIKKNGYEPLIYGNAPWISNNYDLSYLSDYGIWLAHYNETTNYGYDYKMWQYTGKGQIPGISTYVDLNIYFCGKEV